MPYKPNHDRKHALTALEAVRALHDDTGRLMGQQPDCFTISSRASQEARECPEPSVIRTAISQGRLLLEATADQMMAFWRTTQEPSQAIAPWTCVRSELESAALCAWLLDPGIDMKTRAGRSLAFRYEGIRQEQKLASCHGNYPTSSELEQRIAHLESLASRLGFGKVRNCHGKRIGVAMQMPSATEAVRDMLDAESFYRMLSGMAHAHSWAVHKLGVVACDSVPGGEVSACGAEWHALEKGLTFQSVVFLCVTAAESFIKSAWHMWLLSGWNCTVIRNILDESADLLDLKCDRRIWRPQENSGPIG